MNKHLNGSDMFWRGAWKFQEPRESILWKFREDGHSVVNSAIVQSIQFDGRGKLWGWGSPRSGVEAE